MVAPEPSRPAADTRYREVCHLASGGMAELHLARMVGVGGFERLVVIKRLKAQAVGSPDLAQGLLDEARIAATLQHGNIVQVHDVAFEQGAVSIVMEYLHGQDVRTLLRRAGAHLPDGLLALDHAIAIALGVCAGLHHAHERVDATGKRLEIVHRDVSADNVFVTYDGGVKLIDFGIARAHSRMGQTEVGITKGKPAYMAPEQVLGDALDRRTDVHAAAVLLYEMTCGRLPRDGESVVDRFNATVETDAIPPSTVRPGYPEELEAIVLRGLARDPEQRFQTALEMQRALEQFAQRRKLDLSSFGLARVMDKMFRDKLDAWKAAQEAGRSLADHVAAVRQSTMAIGQIAPPSIASPSPSPGPAPAPIAARPHRRLGVAHALLGLVVVAAVALGVWQASKDEPRDLTPVPAIEPMPAPVVPEPEIAPAPPPPTAIDTAAVELDVEPAAAPPDVAPPPDSAPAPVRVDRPGKREPHRPSRRKPPRVKPPAQPPDEEVDLDAPRPR